LTLWIHGYNNNQSAIAETWQTTAAALALRGVSVDDVVAFYWPGDQWGSVLASAAAYPLQVPVARQAAAKLVTYLTHVSHQRELRLRIVAHSLGCLLTLELIRLLDEQRKTHRITVERVLLMAAAVPQGLCKPGLGPFDRRTGIAHEDRVLYSSSDKVLGFAFRFGQRGAELFNWAQTPPLASWEYRRAVGREGAPEYRWSGEPMTGFDHGDYWTAHNVYGEIEAIIGKAAGRVEEKRPSTQTPGVRGNVEERTVAERSVSPWHGRLTGWRTEADPALGAP